MYLYIYLQTRELPTMLWSIKAIPGYPPYKVYFEVPPIKISEVPGTSSRLSHKTKDSYLDKLVDYSYVPPALTKPAIA